MGWPSSPRDLRAMSWCGSIDERLIEDSEIEDPGFRPHAFDRFARELARSWSTVHHLRIGGSDGHVGRRRREHLIRIGHHLDRPAQTAFRRELAKDRCQPPAIRDRFVQ